MRKNEVGWIKYVLVLALTLLVFFFGLLLGNYLTERKAAALNDIEENLRIQTSAAELQYLLLLQQPCKYINGTPLANELYSISEKVDYMEAQRGAGDKDVERLKNTYSILELRDWLFTIRTNEQCGLTQVPVLYFYSNAGDCPTCKEQGYVLTYLRKKYPSLRVYAFDMTTANPALDTLKAINKVEAAPVLIFPDERLGYADLATLETLLSEHYNLTATT